MNLLTSFILRNPTRSKLTKGLTTIWAVPLIIVHVLSATHMSKHTSRRPPSSANSLLAVPVTMGQVSWESSRSASECSSLRGLVFIYDADSGVAVHSLVSEPSDEVCGLNCVRAHPVLGTSCIATSGLDHHVQLFSTSASTRSNVDRSDLVEINQRKLKRYQATSLPGHTTSQVALLIQGLLAGQTPFLFISRDL